jgi:hypothetical protein
VHIFRRAKSAYFFDGTKKCIFSAEPEVHIFNGQEVLCSARLAAALLLSLLHALFLRLRRLQGLTNQPGGRSVSAHFGFGFGGVQLVRLRSWLVLLGDWIDMLPCFCSWSWLLRQQRQRLQAELILADQGAVRLGGACEP